MQYTDLLMSAGNFIALDISVRSTGWVRYYEQCLEYGTYSLHSTDDRERRNEFADFLEQLMRGRTFDYIVIEDVIFGNNFKTTKALMQLNVVPETMMDYGRLPKIPVERIGNSIWKRCLYQLLPEGTVLMGDDDKTRIQFALHTLGFNAERAVLAQDIYDAMGLGLAKLAMLRYGTDLDKTQEPIKLHTSLYKRYKLKQYADESTLAQDVAAKSLRARKEQRSVVWLRSCATYSTLDKHFKVAVEEHGERCIFAIAYDIGKVGALLLRKPFDTALITDNTVWFSAYL